MPLPARETRDRTPTGLGPTRRPPPQQPDRPGAGPLWQRLALAPLAAGGVSQPGDPLEAEADRVAQQVLAAGPTVGGSGVAVSAAPPGQVQRQSIPEAVDLGEDETTAPIATLSPQRQMNQELDRELVRIARGRLLLPWIDERFTFSLDDLMADGSLLKSLDLTQDKALRHRIYPFKDSQPPAKGKQVFTPTAEIDALLKAPTTKEEMADILSLLVFHGAVFRMGDSEDYFAAITRVEAGLQRETFDQKAAAIEQFAGDFKARVARRDSLHPTVGTEPLPSGWSAGTKSQRDPDKLAVATREHWEKQVADAPEGPQREAAEKQLADARKKEARAQGYRTFASPVVELLERLRARNDRWRAGTYPRHWWGEFSVDVFLQAPIEKNGFWRVSNARTFFEDLNAACEDSSPPGKFAWKAIYNDEVIREEINRRFGDGRVLQAPGHGPDKLHIHLDLRPLTFNKDETTGYGTDQGHIVLPENSPP